MTALQNNTIVIKKETIKRLASDVKDLLEDPLENEGIYYIHNEDDILKGKALIIGAKNTPYKYGYYFLNLNFQLIILFRHQKSHFIQMMALQDLIQIYIVMVKYVYQY